MATLTSVVRLPQGRSVHPSILRAVAWVAAAGVVVKLAATAGDGTDLGPASPAARSAVDAGGGIIDGGGKSSLKLRSGGNDAIGEGCG